MRRTVAAAGTALALTLAAGASTAAAADPVVMAAGDVACASPGSTTPGKCSQTYTSNLALAQQASPEGLAALLVLGDEQYPNGSLSDFQSYFDPSWGRLRSVLRPAPGNHEYNTSGAAGYFDYFSSIGVPTGARGQGWYSFNVGTWHFISLNSSNGCSPVSCAAGSPQETWLRSDLAANAQPCVVAYWHHPLSNVVKERDMWQDLYDAGVDFVLTGHVHRYSRPTARDPNGTSDSNGPREAIVGTGGDDDNGSGLLKLTLHANSAEWSFVGSGASDSGSATCHGSAPPPPPPPPPPPSKPAPDFESTPEGLTVAFEDQSTNSPTSWTWSFGDGTTGTLQNPVHAYASAGTYTVTLTAKNGGGSASATQRVTVSPAAASPLAGAATATPAAPALAVLAQTASGPSPALGLGLKLRARRVTFDLLRRGLPVVASGPAGQRLNLSITVSQAIARGAHLERRRLVLRTLRRPALAHLRVSARVLAALRAGHGPLTLTISVWRPGRHAVARRFTLRR
jgi:PKD repeat protein